MLILRPCRTVFRDITDKLNSLVPSKVFGLSSPRTKNIRLNASGKSAVSPRPSHPTRGACARHETRGGMRWTLMSRRRTWLTRTAKSCGPGARRWRQVRETQASHGRRWQKSPSPRGDHEVSRKPLRREGRSVSAEPVCSCAFSSHYFAHETAGAARTRSSLRPPIDRRVNIYEKLGRIMPRECGRIPFRYLTS